MIRFFKIALLLICCTIMQGCLFDSNTKKLNDRYCLLAIDSDDNMELCYVDENDNMFSVIHPTVFAVGQNKDYIIAKQHPDGLITQTNYYIIPLTDTLPGNPENNIIGPLTEQQFTTKAKELGINELEFSIVFDGVGWERVECRSVQIIHYFKSQYINGLDEQPHYLSEKNLPNQTRLLGSKALLH